MATSEIPMCAVSGCWFLLFLCLSSSLSVKAAVSQERIEAAEESAYHHHQYERHHHNHIIHINSLFSSNSCDRSSKAAADYDQGGVSLEVAHRHGSCFKHKIHKSNSLPNHSHILQQDQARVDSIHTRLNPKSSGVVETTMQDNNSKDLTKRKETRGGGLKSVELPALSGSQIGSANYVVTVGLGTPKRDLSLIFDTGSDLTWTQCEPCIKSCYQQKDPIFNPSASSSYSNISCSSKPCTYLTEATGQRVSCSGPTCIYGLAYGDSSFSVGFFARDKLTLGPNFVFEDFLFGCGENNQGLFSGSAGLLGLGRQRLSVVSQIADRFGGKYFSYCLPSDTSTGRLTFGSGGKTVSRYIQYTPLLPNPTTASSFYFLGLEAISVGGHRLSIPSTVFSIPGTLIDSGTVITRLPPTAYTALRDAFRRLMSSYPAAPALSILDTCFDLTNSTTVVVPKVSLHFQGGATMDLAINGILYTVKVSQVCLAFAGNSDPTDVVILGNVQQQTFDVIYDVAGGRLGFGSGGCR